MNWNKISAACVYNKKHDFAIVVDFGNNNDVVVKTEFMIIDNKLIVKEQSIIGHSCDFNDERKNIIINDIETIINQKH